jgi:hypothetical protein
MESRFQFSIENYHPYFFFSKCTLEKNIERNEISSNFTKNMFLLFYIIIMFLSLAINIITFILIINDHKKFLRKLFRTRNSSNHKIKNSNNFTHASSLKKNQLGFNNNNNNNNNKLANQTQPQNNTTNNNMSARKSSQISSLNSISDILMFNLLTSNLIITLYVIPNQIHLFYSNTHLILSNCKIGEFLKAFSVSLSIYSLVSISFQRLIVIKFTLFSFSPLVNKTRLIDLFHCFSVSSFFKSIGTIISTFFCSITYRRYLITIILLLLTWSISILISLLHSSHYTEEKVDLDLETFKEQFACDFEPSLKPINYFCTADRETNNKQQLFSLDDLIFLILLLVIPNFVVLLSYSWVCYHVWSSSHNFNVLNLHNCCMKQNKSDVDKANNNKNVKLNHSNAFNNNLTDSSTDQQNLLRENKQIKSLNNKTTYQQSSHQFVIKKRNVYITFSTFLMIFCFSICWTPFFTFPIFYSKINDTNFYNNIKVIVHLIGYSSSVWNPIILITKSKRFKPKFKFILDKLSFNNNSNQNLVLF